METSPKTMYFSRCSGPHTSGGVSVCCIQGQRACIQLCDRNQKLLKTCNTTFQWNPYFNPVFGCGYRVPFLFFPVQFVPEAHLLLSVFPVLGVQQPFYRSLLVDRIQTSQTVETFDSRKESSSPLLNPSDKSRLSKPVAIKWTPPLQTSLRQKFSIEDNVIFDHHSWGDATGQGCR